MNDGNYLGMALVAVSLFIGLVWITVLVLDYCFVS